MSKPNPIEMDAETAAFAESVRLSLIQAKRGRPTDSKRANVKVLTTLGLDEAALARWRASGKGWQSRVALVLAQHAPG